MSTESRLASLRRKMAARRLDALIVTQRQNLRYLADFPDEDAALFITGGSAHILTDFRYIGMVQNRCAGFTLVEIKGADPVAKAVSDLVDATGAKKVGFEARDVTYESYRALRKALLRQGKAAARLVPAPRFVEELRAIKDPAELAAIGRAAAIADEALARFMARLRAPGSPAVTERQAAWELERTMRDLGAEGTSFPVDVASGPNSAVPHHAAGDRVLGQGEPIWIDMGARVDGYCSDLTRTFCLGEPDERFREIYALVLEAQLAAEKAVRDGVSGKVVDAAARDVIAKAGYAEAFGHGTGHGVGLAIHEEPNMGSTRHPSGQVRAGNVVTVEPGVYLPGWGGVRIEDLVVVTRDGCRILSASPK